MPDFYQLLRPVLRALPPETAHRLSLAALAAGFGGRTRVPDPPILAQVGDVMRVEIEKIGVLENPVVAATR